MVYRSPIFTAKVPKRVELTERQARILRTMHEHPELTTAGKIADHLGDVTTWDVCMDNGSMLVDAMFTVKSGRYHLTKAGADAIGVPWSASSSGQPSTTTTPGQLGLFGGSK